MVISEKELARLQTELETACRRAGDVIREFYENGSAKKTIKADNTPVTDADYAANDILQRDLQSVFPGTRIVSEEDDTDPGADDVFLTIDPLDGTQEFIDGTWGFSTKAMLIVRQRPWLGAVHSPMHGITYASRLNGPAERITATGQRRIMRVREPSPDRPLKALFNMKSNGPERYAALRKEFSKRSVFISGRASHTPGLPRNLRVAEGSADLHIGRDGYPWDLAADELCVLNAGGDFFSLETGQTLTYGRPRTLMGPYIATNDRTLRTKLFPNAKGIDPVWTF